MGGKKIKMPIIITVIFSNVTGLGFGNPVYYEGYRVGQVEKLHQKTRWEVQI
jgi:ABC-type transporter Mla subunit MlaD